jgi:predicted transcriptional regulator
MLEIYSPLDPVRLDRIHQRLRAIAPRTRSALLDLIETALTVVERHANDCRGAEAWLDQTPEYHIQHALAHVAQAENRDEDGLSEASHAVCRLAFLLALVPDLKS